MLKNVWHVQIGKCRDSKEMMVMQRYRHRHIDIAVDIDVDCTQLKSRMCVKDLQD